MTKLVIPALVSKPARCRLVGLLISAVTLLATGTLSAQEGRRSLVPVSGLMVPDSIPLTYVEQLITRADGSVFLIDRRTDGVLAFDADGEYQRRIGRQGEGPGELLSPWRLGLLGQDTLWVVDAGRPRVNFYDASTGAGLADLGPARWEDAAAGGEPLRPFAVLADHSVAAFRWAERDVRAELLAFHMMGPPPYTKNGPLAVLDVRDRSLAIPVPAGGGGLKLRNPYSYSDMLAIDGLGTHFVLVRRPEPTGSYASFIVELHDVRQVATDTLRVPYTARPVESEDIRVWAEELGPVERMVELGVFPSRVAGVAAVLNALDEPQYYPPVRNRGRGILEDGVLIDAGAAVWLQIPNNAGRTNDWLVVSNNGHVSYVVVPDGARLLAVRGDRVWAEMRDGFGVPSVRVLEVPPSGK
ncbi:6-bladed beta-propeller [Candidatus Palauibacter sp.]|uniref:6-bladed beta-propeller n=1 Tax=Candidatus Palauibacter sp. TaxID=3101350 RepID=UPI003B011F1D